jgi:hypothetical protein
MLHEELIAGRRPKIMPLRPSPLTALPVELVHNIFRAMDTASVLSTRLTCHFLSKIGLDHFGDEVPLVFHRDKFRALTEIAAHPVLSKRIASLYYAGDLLKLEDWYQWDIRRSPEKYYRFAVMEFATEDELRLRVSRLEPRRALGVMDLCPIRTKVDVAAFGRYNELCTDQAKIIEEKLDISCLSTLFEGCPKLREVTLAFRSDNGGPQRRLKASRTAFAEAMTVAHSDYRDPWTNRHHLEALAQAAQRTGRSLDSLTVVNIDYSVLYEGGQT